MVKNGYYGNEDLDLIRDSIKVRQIAAFITTLNNFDSIWLQNMHNLFTDGHGSLSSFLNCPFLSHLLEVFERIIYKQINSYMEDKFTKCLTGFRKLHDTKHSLLTMLENGKEELIMERMFLLYLRAFQRPLILSTMILCWRN